jgi:hypothetical protein
MICVCITLCGLNAAAQEPKFVLNEPDKNKPRLFDNLPEIIPISIDNLNILLNSKTGATISTDLSTDSKSAHFEGTVVSSVSKYDDKVQTVLIKSANYNDASLYISKVITQEGNVKYNGRLMSFKYGDAYVLQKKDGAFMLVKKNFYEVVNE